MTLKKKTTPNLQGGNTVWVLRGSGFQFTNGKETTALVAVIDLMKKSKNYEVKSIKFYQHQIANEAPTE